MRGWSQRTAVGVGHVYHCWGPGMCRALLLRYLSNGFAQPCLRGCSEERSIPALPYATLATEGLCAMHLQAVPTFWALVELCGQERGGV